MLIRVLENVPGSMSNISYSKDIKVAREKNNRLRLKPDPVLVYSEKFLFYRITPNQQEEANILLYSKIISNIAKSIQIFYEFFLNTEKLKICYDFTIG